MKMNRLFLALAVAGATGPFAGPAFGQELGAALPLLSSSSVGRIGDSPRSISDGMPTLNREISTPDFRPDEFRNNTIDPALQAKKITDDHWGSISDKTVSYASPSESESDMLDDGTGTSFDPIPMETYRVSTPSTRSYSTPSNSTWWAETEALLWFARQSSTPPLAVSGPRGTFPTNVVAGGPVAGGGELAPGMRANLGKWLNAEKSIGIGGRVFGIFNGDSTQTITSDGSVSLGVPVFDVFSGTNQTILVAFDTGALGRDTGSISVSDNNSFFTAEAYGRLLLAGEGKNRADLIGGYTFTRFDNSTTLQTTSIDGITNSTPDGTVTTTLDSFGAQNSFHGGHIGILSDISSGFCTVSTIGKIALGNMHSTTNVFGSTTEDAPGPSIITSPGGLITGPNIAGSQTRDKFTFLPELGAKLRLDLTSSLQFSVGYTLIIIPDTVLSSDLVNTMTDLSGFTGLPPTPGGVVRDQVTYLQGVDLGLSLKF